MVRDISRALGTSLHHQIQAVIRDGIGTGRYGVGEMLPTESELCEMFSVSRITVRRAMDALEHEGLIARQQGRGTIVLPQHAASPADESDGFLRHLSSVVANTKPTVIDFGLVSPPPDACKALRLSSSDLALRIVRIRQRNDRPILHTTMYVGQHLAEKITRDDFASAPAASVLIKCGYTYRHVYYSTGAALADPILAAQLGVQVGAPLVDLRRVSTDQNGQPFEYMKLLGPPDRFRFEVTMQRDDSGEFTLVSGP